MRHTREETEGESMSCIFQFAITSLTLFKSKFAQFFLVNVFEIVFIVNQLKNAILSK